MRALVVDDSNPARLHAGRVLAELGFRVWGASDGDQALDALQKLGPVDVVLLDWDMPEVTGLDVLRALRATDRFREQLIVMATSRSNPEDLMAALDGGANEYVMKPYSREDIADKLRILGFAFEGDEG